MVVDKTLGGRPPLVIPDEELDSLGEDLLAWLDDEGCESAFFQDWFFDIKGYSRTDWKGLIKREGFRPYYEIARQKMASNMMKSDLDKGYVHRYLGKYDDELHEFEEEVKDRDSARKSKENGNFINFPENLAKMQDFFSQVQKMQTSSNTIPAIDHKE